jgi:hypothetical protein
MMFVFSDLPFFVEWVVADQTISSVGASFQLSALHAASFGEGDQSLTHQMILHNGLR